jgi:urease accessory protein
VLEIQKHPRPGFLPEYTEREQVAPRPRATASTPGTGSLQFTRVGGHTAVTRARAQSPLKLLCPRGAGPSAWAFVSNYGGGLVAGDDVRLRLHAGEETTSLLSTQSSTKVYRTRSEIGARQSISARIDAGALCVAAPDPVTCFAGARFEQHSQWHLDETASLVLVDSLSSGRVAHGERWALSHYKSSNEIFLGNRRVFRDVLLLDPVDGPLDDPQRMGRIDCLAMIVLIGPRVLPAAVEALSSITAQRPGLDRATRLLISASPLRVDGNVLGATLRVAGAGIEPVGRFLRSTLAFLCPILGEDPWKRKW